MRSDVDIGENDERESERVGMKMSSGNDIVFRWVADRGSRLSNCLI